MGTASQDQHLEEETKGGNPLGAAFLDRNEEMEIHDRNPTDAAGQDHHVEEETKDRNPTDAASHDQNEEMEAHDDNPTDAAGQDQQSEEEKTYEENLNDEASLQ